MEDTGWTEELYGVWHAHACCIKKCVSCTWRKYCCQCWDRLVLDVGTFTSLQIGDERELLDVSDQTMNEKYNGSLTLGL